MAITMQLADLAADEVARLFDAAVLVDEDRAVAKKAIGEDRDRDERRIGLLEAAQVIGDAELGDVELAFHRPFHNRADLRRAAVFELDAFGLDAAIGKRASAVVLPAAEDEFELLHETPLSMPFDSATV